MKKSVEFIKLFREQTCVDVKPVIGRMKDTLLMNPKIDLTSVSFS